MSLPYSVRTYIPPLAWQKSAFVSLKEIPAPKSGGQTGRWAHGDILRFNVTRGKKQEGWKSKSEAESFCIARINENPMGQHVAADEALDVLTFKRSFNRCNGGYGYPIWK